MNTPATNAFLRGPRLYRGFHRFDPAVPIEDAQLRTNSAFVGDRVPLAGAGLSGKAAMLMPYTGLDGSARVGDEPQQRQALLVSRDRWLAFPSISLVRPHYR